jgi:hypothetical protein
VLTTGTYRADGQAHRHARPHAATITADLLAWLQQ